MISIRNNHPAYRVFEPFFGFDDFGVKSNHNQSNYRVKEDEHGLQLFFALPGFSKDEIEISIEAGKLQVEAKLSEGKEHYFASTQQRFAFSLDAAKYDSEAAEANYQDGVLSIRLPKTEAYSNKRILKLT